MIRIIAKWGEKVTVLARMFNQTSIETCLVHWKTLTYKQRKSILEIFFQVILIEILELLLNSEPAPELLKLKVRDLKKLRMMARRNGKKLCIKRKGFFREKEERRVIKEKDDFGKNEHHKSR